MPYRFLLALLLVVTPAVSQTISTIVGGGNGDGNTAIQAAIDLPYNVAADGKGNVFISDQTSHLIRKVDSRGLISTFAGSGVPGFADGPAAQARFYFPAGIRLDTTGNLYVADTGNNRIRKVDLSGNTTTVAGSGTAGDSGDNGPALSAQLRTPYGVVLDEKGNIYIADSNNNRVKRVDTAGNITTIAGTGSFGFGGDGGAATLAALNFPLGLAIDSVGNLYIADSGNSRVRKIDSSGKMSTVAGTSSAGWSGDGGPATQARMTSPQDVALGPDGSLYVADSYLGATAIFVVRRVDGQGNISTVAGIPSRLGFGGDSSLATAALLFAPSGVALDAFSRLYIADSKNHRVRIVENGVIRTFAGGAVMDNGPATQAALSLLPPAPVGGSNGLRFDALGNLYIADTSNHRIRLVDAATGNIRTIAGGGVPGFAGDGGPAASALLYYPQGIAFDADNNLYIADTWNNRVRKVTPGGAITTIAGTGSARYTAAEDGGPATKASLASPSAVAIDSAGNVYIADRGNRRIRKIDAATSTISTLAGNGATALCGSSLSCGDSGPATKASFADPRDIALDAQDNLFIADASASATTGALIGGFRVRRVDASGNIATVAGNGQLDANGDGNPPTSAGIGVPAAITLDVAGNLFIADERNYRIRKAAAGGTISTLAGSSVFGFAGDDGPAASALLSRPRALAVDSTGNLLIADSDNNRVRRITGVAASSPRRRMVVVSGNRQTGAIGSVLSEPLGVALFDGSTAVGGVIVQFTVSPSGAADLNPAQAVTDSSGKASTAATLKGTPGQLTVTATSTLADPVVFTLSAVPGMNPNGAVNGASFGAGAGLAPGAIVSLFGHGLARDIAFGSFDSSKHLSTNLLGSEIRVQSGSQTIAAPLFYVSPLQVNFQMPYELTVGSTVNLVVASGGVESSPMSVNVIDATPGIFTWTQDGKGAGIFLHADFKPVNPSNPARPGETVLVYCTGLGAVTPVQASGTAAPSNPPATTSNFPDVSIAGIPAIVDFSGLAPGFVGLYQINVRIPTTAPSGLAVSLAVTVGKRVSNAVTIPLL